MKELILFPFNGNSREALSIIADINKQQSTWKVLGFVDDDPCKRGLTLGGYSVLGGRDKLLEYQEASILAVPGRPENFIGRASLINPLDLPANRFATIIHPSVQLGIDCTVGRNVLISGNVVLTSQVTISDHVVILSNTVIAHESHIGPFSMIGSNVSISGGVRVAENCYIGSGTRIIQEVEIGTQAMVGLGAVVIRDVPPGGVVAGNPARLL